VLNLAEGNGKRSHPDRCRYFDLARGSAVECAACLDVLRAKPRVTDAEVAEGKTIPLEVVSMTAGLLARFSSPVREETAPYGEEVGIEEKEKD
jgi:four helix bundle protein